MGEKHGINQRRDTALYWKLQGGDLNGELLLLINTHAKKVHTYAVRTFIRAPHITTHMHIRVSPKLGKTRERYMIM